MGFMDKAKKFAEQAQTKADELQKQFNETQGSGASQQSTPAVEYDSHGRKVTSAGDPSLRGPQAETADPEPPHGDPLGAEATSVPSGDPLAQPTTRAVPPSEQVSPGPAAPTPVASDPEPPHGDPLLTGENASRHGADADRGERPVTPPPGQSPGMTSGDPLAG